MERHRRRSWSHDCGTSRTDRCEFPRRRRGAQSNRTFSLLRQRPARDGLASVVNSLRRSAPRKSASSTGERPQTRRKSFQCKPLRLAKKHIETAKDFSQEADCKAPLARQLLKCASVESEHGTRQSDVHEGNLPAGGDAERPFSHGIGHPRTLISPTCSSFDKCKTEKRTRLSKKDVPEFWSTWQRPLGQKERTDVQRTRVDQLPAMSHLSPIMILVIETRSAIHQSSRSLSGARSKSVLSMSCCEDPGIRGATCEGQRS